MNQPGAGRDAPGCVYLVGAGPGAPDLLTLRAARLLDAADIVFHDALVHPGVLAPARQARLVAVGKRNARPSTDQRFINRQLVEAARRHATVVRLKGGDPMLFGRAQEEIDALEAAGVRVEVVPGVTAALAASAELRVSLTLRGVSRSVLFATPRVGNREGPGAWADGCAKADTLALYMAAGEASAVATELIRRGRPDATPATVVENASLPGSRRIATTLAALRDEGLPALAGPALLLVGEVFGDREAAIDRAGCRPDPTARLGTAP